MLRYVRLSRCNPRNPKVREEEKRGADVGRKSELPLSVIMKILR